MTVIKQICQIFATPPNKAIFPHIRQDYIERMFNRNQILLHLLDDQTIGGLITWMQYKRDDARQIGNKLDIQIKQIAVHPKHQNLGIGTILFHRLEDLAKQLHAPKICLSVRTSNTNARAFYEKMGMQVIKTTQWQEKGQPLPGLIYQKPVTADTSHEDIVF